MRVCLYLVLFVGAVTAGTVPDDNQAISVVRVDRRTGRLVRSVVVNQDKVAPAVQALAVEAARTYDVSAELVNSVIAVESNFNPLAVSPKGAQGLMQLMPDTARRFGVKNSFDPKENIEGGVKYLKFLQDTFQDDRLAVAAYNAGEKAVARYGTVPPYKETLDYVDRVGKKLGKARRVSAMKKNTSATLPETESQETAEQHPRLVQMIDAEGRVYLSTR